MIDGEISAGSSHAAHYLVGNHQNAVVVTNLGDLFQITIRGHDRAQSCPADRLENHRRDFAVIFSDRLLDLGGILLAAVEAAIAAVVNATVAIRRVDGRKLAQHGTINFAPALIARNSYRTQRRAVIALIAGDDLRTLGHCRFPPDIAAPVLKRFQPLPIRHCKNKLLRPQSSLPRRPVTRWHIARRPEL